MALRRLSTLRETRSFGAWLAAIARNLAHDHYRRSAPTERIEDEFDPEIQKGACTNREDEDAAQVLDTIRNLPDAYRETLILRLVEGMTGPEIAARTGLTHGSVRVNLHRGMQMLRARLSPKTDGDVSEKEVR
jgi:RNA polymerase sigma-70 factor (ECF subfamily)